MYKINTFKTACPGCATNIYLSYCACVFFYERIPPKKSSKAVEFDVFQFFKLFIPGISVTVSTLKSQSLPHLAVAKCCCILCPPLFLSPWPREEKKKVLQYFLIG